ncbi:MAG: tRNA pseudouridine(38-40) synthase TruA [Bacteroidaceae bacterium]|nr:tRNA pseudouridine(38-40) synthase TruA [Bacteroidaceae bacterium]
MRYFIYLSYDGTKYHGWQIQPNGNSIQAELNRAVSIICGTTTEVVGAGRTDAGVHAAMMIAHFDNDNTGIFSNADKNLHEVCNLATERLNRILPRDIAISKVRAVTNEAHARFSATARTYQYFIHKGRTPFMQHYSYCPPYPIDFNKMNEAAQCLFDYIDFTSFSKLHTDVKNNNCKIMSACWKKVSQESPNYDNDNLLFPNEETWVFTIQADRFLRNMIRAIVGTLLDVGRGAITIEDFRNIIEQKNRCSAGMSVPANALFLTDIQYPEELFIQ